MTTLDPNRCELHEDPDLIQLLILAMSLPTDHPIRQAATALATKRGITL